MKKYILRLFMMIAFAFATVQANAETKSIAPEAKTLTEESAQANVLISRLEQINAMDKSELSFSEKRALRKEVNGIKRQLKSMSDGVYISVGAIIIIALLLILLL